MKFLIASDLHGSATHTRTLMDRIDREAPDRVLLLGDLLYHGPRNDLPEGYAPKEVLSLLNGIADQVVAVRGNCDAEVDQMVLDFPCMADYTIVTDGSYTLHLSHGHVPGNTPDDLPPLPVQAAFLSGHTHVKELARRQLGHDAGERRTVVLINPGSVSLPKDGSHSYALYEDGMFSLKTLEGAVLSTLDL